MVDNIADGPVDEARTFQALAEHSPDIIVRFGRDLVCQYANRATASAMGRVRGELPGLSVGELGLPGGAASALARLIHKAFETKRPQEVELDIPTSGMRIWSLAIPELATYGEVATVLWVAREAGEPKGAAERVMELSDAFRDVSRELAVRKLAAESKREGEGLFRDLVEGLGQGFIFFYVHDTAGRFTYLSPSVTSVLGFSQDELLRHGGFFLIDGPINEAAANHTVASLNGEQQSAYLVEVRHKNGRVRVLEVMEVPVRNSRDEVVAVQGIAHDITSCKKMEALLAACEARERDEDGADASTPGLGTDPAGQGD